MNTGAIACGIIGVTAVTAAFHSKGEKAFGFWLLAAFALIGAANS